ncbi:hypothetical protein HanHA89_Chr02g0078221 [Helianthus annuus]|nr:hypothetical protein HanHA89_Chr02g0078221 [Helianthus annuus]
MDGVNEPDKNGKISNLLDPDTEKQTSGRKSQNWQGRHVYSGPRLEFQRTRTRGILLFLRTLTSRSVISTGSSTNCNRSSIVSSFNGIIRVSSDKHFFRFDTWKTL